MRDHNRSNTMLNILWHGNSQSGLSIIFCYGLLALFFVMFCSIGYKIINSNDSIEYPEFTESDFELKPVEIASIKYEPPPIVPPELKPVLKPEKVEVADVPEVKETEPELVAEEDQEDGNGIKYHVVKQGESLWQIAKDYDVKLTTLLDANNLSKKSTIKPNQKLIITPSPGIFVKVDKGESLWQICRRYDVSLAKVVDANDIEDPSLIQPKTEIFLPGAKSDDIARSMFEWPLKGRLSSKFGWRTHPMGGGFKFHYGIDIAAPSGKTIAAACSGVVIYAGWRGSMGRSVIIQHKDGYSTVYGHASKLLVKKGQYVSEGTPIMKVGRSGVATGPHLHFEIRHNGKAINPLTLLK